jgi:hypothetical protein
MSPGELRDTLNVMDEHFGDAAAAISSRAVAVSAYLFVEDLCSRGKVDEVPSFAAFYLKLLEAIKSDLKLLGKFREPANRTILEEFQRHVSQASVEPFAIKARNRFLEKAFRYYRDPKTKGKVIGSK